MSDPTLKRTSVQIKYTSSDGFRAEFGGKAGTGTRHRITGEEVPPQNALIAGFEELARLAALFGFERKLERALKLSRNSPKASHLPDQTEARIMMRRKGYRHGAGAEQPGAAL